MGGYVMSEVDRLGLWGALVMAGFLLIAQTALFRMAVKLDRRSGDRRHPTFFDLVVTREDNRYSISRLQVYLWTVAAVISYAAVATATHRFVAVPQNLALLLGVNLGAAVSSTAIYTAQESKRQASGAPAERPGRAERVPSFARDIFFESDQPTSLDLPRTQMFLWTVVTLATYAIIMVWTFPAIAAPANGSPSLPDIPLGMVGLMGISQITYLGAKAASFTPVDATPGPSSGLDLP